jgi:hypothetical protein
VIPHVDIDRSGERPFVTIETRYGTLDLVPTEARKLAERLVKAADEAEPAEVKP